MTDKNENWIQLGECFHPHGIKGEFQFKLFNGEDSVIRPGDKLRFSPLKESSSLAKSGEIFEIEKIRFGNKVIVKLVDVSDRNTVEAMVPFAFWMKREDFPNISDDEVYLVDLVGREFFTNSSEGPAGSIESFYDNGAQVIGVLKLTDGKIIELPMVKNFFPKITEERIEVILPQEEES